jgi:hypothetical protein
LADFELLAGCGRHVGGGGGGEVVGSVGLVCQRVLLLGSYGRMLLLGGKFYGARGNGAHEIDILHVLMVVYTTIRDTVGCTFLSPVNVALVTRRLRRGARLRTTCMQ